MAELAERRSQQMNVNERQNWGTADGAMDDRVWVFHASLDQSLQFGGHRPE
jgi:hypothetical protein